MRLFEGHHDYSFINQLKRAALSIVNNIAEWFERQTNNEFRYFLFVAKWSCGEVRSMLYVARDLDYIQQDLFEELYKETIEISKMLSGLIKKL
jgi:four helix bundle protein